MMLRVEDGCEREWFGVEEEEEEITGRSAEDDGICSSAEHCRN